MNAFYQEDSFGTLGLTGKVRADGDVFGWFQLPSSSAGCNFDSWGDQAINAATSAGLDMTGYDHFLFFYPFVSSCGFSGVAYIGPFGPHRAWINGTLAGGVSAHELGHSFGVHHASSYDCSTNGTRMPLGSSCTRSEYGDPFDVMGDARAFHQHDAFHKAQLGFLPPSRMLTTSTNGTYTLEPLDKPGTGYAALRIPLSSGPNAGWYLYLEYRQPVGFDGFSPSDPVVNGITVRLAPDTSTVTQSLLLDQTSSTGSFVDSAVLDGATFNDPASGVTFTQVSHSASGAVVRLGAAPPPPPPPPAAGSHPAVMRGARWYLRNSLTTGAGDTSFIYGTSGDVPVMGDWDGDGVKTPGVFRNGTWFLRNSNTAGSGDIAFTFGQAGDIPVVGDWTGGGRTLVGVFRAGTWYLRNTLTAGPADASFVFGQQGDQPIAGDWTAGGKALPGVFRNGTWYLRNTLTNGVADANFIFGQQGDVPLLGDWLANGATLPGVFRNGTWYLRNTLTAGAADSSFGYAMTGDLPVIW